jgi:hypothetical protein
MSTTPPSWDELHEVANGQSGHFTARQAADAGFSPQLLHKHVQSGNLEHVERGIYRITRFPPSEHEDLVVLWLWSGQEAVFSHETALQLHELSDALPAMVHLTMPTSTSRRKRVPEGTVIHLAAIAPGEREWLGPVPVTKPARSVLDVAAAHGDAALVAQAIDQGIRGNLFTFDQVAPAGRYVANAQGWGTPIRPVTVDGEGHGLGDGYGQGMPDGSGYGSGLGDGYGMGLPDGSGQGEDLGDRFYSRPISGTCTKRPPADWPTVAAELGKKAGAHLRVAQYLPSRTMFLEFAWRFDRIPDERDVKALRKRLSRRFSWA